MFDEAFYPQILAINEGLFVLAIKFNSIFKFLSFEIKDNSLASLRQFSVNDGTPSELAFIDSNWLLINVNVNSGDTVICEPTTFNVLQWVKLPRISNQWMTKFTGD